MEMIIKPSHTINLITICRSFCLFIYMSSLLSLSIFFSRNLLFLSVSFAFDSSLLIEKKMIFDVLYKNDKYLLVSSNNWKITENSWILRKSNMTDVHDWPAVTVYPQCLHPLFSKRENPQFRTNINITSWLSHSCARPKLYFLLAAQLHVTREWKSHTGLKPKYEFEIQLKFLLWFWIDEDLYVMYFLPKE